MERNLRKKAPPGENGTEPNYGVGFVSSMGIEKLQFTTHTIYIIDPPYRSRTLVVVLNLGSIQQNSYFDHSTSFFFNPFSSLDFFFHKKTGDSLGREYLDIEYPALPCVFVLSKRPNHLFCPKFMF